MFIGLKVVVEPTVWQETKVWYNQAVSSGLPVDPSRDLPQNIEAASLIQDIFILH